MVNFQTSVRFHLNKFLSEIKLYFEAKQIFQEFLVD